MPHESDENGWRLVVAFPDESPSFAHGVEVGKLWARMDANVEADFYCFTMAENREVLRRIAEYLGWSIEFTWAPIEGWDTTIFKKVAPKGLRTNPHGLRVVPDGGG